MLERYTETVFYQRRDTENSKCHASDIGVCSSFNLIPGLSLGQYRSHCQLHMRLQYFIFNVDLVVASSLFIESAGIAIEVERL